MRRLVLILAIVTAFCARGAADDPPLAVIVHPSRSEALSTSDIAQIFLKKRRFWNDRSPIVPLNRNPDSAVREEFSRLVLGLPAERQVTYWNEQYFHGRFPPATLSSDAAVKQYVAQDPNAIGYISADQVDETVRIVQVLSDPRTFVRKPTPTPSLVGTPVWPQGQ